MSAEPCPICTTPLLPEERFCSKACRHAARRHKTYKLQYHSIPVTNEVDIQLRRRAVRDNTTVQQLLIDAVQRGFSK